MTQLIKLAWKNIWRKKRRSIIAIASVMFALLVTISMRSLQLGSYDKMIEAAVKNTGYIQIHKIGYWKDKSINDLIVQSNQVESNIRQSKGVTSIIPRLQNFALSAGDSTSKASMVIGIVPELEDGFNHLSKRVVQGKYIDSNSSGIMLSEGLSRYLKLSVGDTVAIIGQGYQANVASGKYKVEAIVKLANPQLNLMTVYMPLKQAQVFNSSPNMISAYLLNISNVDQSNGLAADIQTSIGSNYEVMNWNTLTPEIGNNIKIDTTIFTLIASALYLIVGFGIIGIIIMMTLERKKEFAMLQANGMVKQQIQILTLSEALLIGLIGVGLAFCIEIPFVNFMHNNPIPLTGEGAKSFEAMGAEPIIQMGIKPALFALMGSIILSIVMISSVFPAFIIGRLKVSESLK